MSRFPQPTLVAKLMAMVGQAETAFRSRWRLATLQRFDAELHQLLTEQIDLYYTALVTGTDEEARDQAEAMVRGWRAAVAALESPLRPDDAYLTGWDPVTNTVVVIAEQKASMARVEIRQGQKVITVTPDEVAKLVTGLNMIAEVKSLFPDAEVISFTRTCSDEEMAAGDAALRADALGRAN